MKSDSSPQGGKSHRNRIQPATRKLKFSSRVRTSFRKKVDRVLGAEIFWSVLFVLVVVLVLSADRWSGGYEELQVGQIAETEIRAHQAFEYPDDARTLELREEARETVLDVYVHDRKKRKTTRASVDSAGNEGTGTHGVGGSLDAAISASGRFLPHSGCVHNTSPVSALTAYI